MVVRFIPAELPSLNHADTSVWSGIQERFCAQLSPLRLFPGAALAVYQRGRLVLDLVAGFADTQRGELVAPDTLFPFFRAPSRSVRSRSGSRSSAVVSILMILSRHIGLSSGATARTA